jgi:type IV pilus assembly protein PilY1
MYPTRRRFILFKKKNLDADKRRLIQILSPDHISVYLRKSASQKHYLKDYSIRFLLWIRNQRSKTKFTAQTLFFSLILGGPVFFPASAEPTDVSTEGHFSRSSPVVQTNVLFSAYYEMTNPSVGDAPQGHVTATRIYDPAVPDHTESAELWDAGKALNKMEPCDRNIYIPNIQVTRMTEVTLATGDGGTRTFSGTLSHPVIATTVRITDQRETFHDERGDLQGDSGGTGTINRFSGVFEVTFNEPPENGAPVKCGYACYTTDTALQAFSNKNVDNLQLGLDNTYGFPEGSSDDLNGDNRFDESDGDYLVQWIRGYSDGSSIKKEWLLGAVDHCTPAVVPPPGRPHWYYGTDITEGEQGAFDSFLEANKGRRTVVYVGARDGMLHAFDGGRFRWGDNPETVIAENRGYFEWMDRDADSSLNQRWNSRLARYSDPPPEFRWLAIGDGDKAPDYGSGNEMWAFIPPHLVGRLQNNLLGKEGQASVDASPAIADVYIRGEWHTILLVGEENGSGAMFCLDITDPERPLFLWEFAESDLVINRSSPTVARIGRIALGGTKRWVAFLGSGKSRDETLDPSIYMIDIADGSMVQRVYLRSGMDNNGDGFDDGSGGVPGQPAIIDSDGNGYIDRLYMGTDKGFMFKVNIPDDPEILQYTISQCVINTDFYYEDSEGDIYLLPPDQQYQPINGSPTVIVDNHFNEYNEIEYNISVFFGTGDNPCANEDASTEDTTFHFFSYGDRNDKGECHPDLVSLEWYKSLPPGHRMVASASAGAGTVYFGTSAYETDDPCVEGDDGRIYAVDMKDGEVIHEETVGNIASSPLVEDEHLYFKTNNSGGKMPVVMGGGKFNNETIKSPDAINGIRSWKEMW